MRNHLITASTVNDLNQNKFSYSPRHNRYERNDENTNEVLSMPEQELHLIKHLSFLYHQRYSSKYQYHNNRIWSL